MTATLAMQGRGLFYGETGPNGTRRIFSPVQWDALCRQASQEWNLQWVHPKVADGGNWWYDPNANNKTGTSLAMLTLTAHHYGLKVAPYHYCYGNKFGGLQTEAFIAATIAGQCDAVCPDMEIEWNGQSQWAIDFGRIFRTHAPQGKVYPTLFGDPSYFPQQPYVEWEFWVDGWIPMVYFSLWTDRYGKQDTAADARDFVFPMWLALDEKVKAVGITPKPILPLVEVGDALPPQEIANWLRLMGGYGYCGFWYDGPYAPYAAAVKSVPVPALPGGPTPVNPPHVPVIETPYVPEPLKGPGLADEPGDPQMNQNLTPSQLAVLWHQNGTTMAMNLNFAIPKLWATLVQKHPDWRISGPLVSAEIPFQVGNEKGTYVDFGGGLRIWYFSEGVLAVSHSSVETPPTRTPALATLETMVAAPPPTTTTTTPTTIEKQVTMATPIVAPIPPSALAPEKPITTGLVS